MWRYTKKRQKRSTAPSQQRGEGKKWSIVSIRFSGKMMIDSTDLIFAPWSNFFSRISCKYQIGAIYHHFSRKSNWNYRSLFSISPLLRRSCRPWFSLLILVNDKGKKVYGPMKTETNLMFFDKESLQNTPLDSNQLTEILSHCVQK